MNRAHSFASPGIRRERADIGTATVQLKPGSQLFAIFLIGLLQPPAVARAEDLVAPDRIGRPDAPKSFSFRVLTVHSNNNAQPKFAAGMTALYEKYAKTHPDWRVSIQLMSIQIPQEHARLLEQARRGTAPDCSAVDSFEVPLFIRAGVLRPIDQYFTKEEIDDLFPFIRPIISDAEGHIYAWWWTTDLRLLYRNTALVPDPPDTWQETKQAAVAARQAAGAGFEGFLFNGGRNETTTVDFLPQFWAQGGKLVDEKGNPYSGRSRTGPISSTRSLFIATWSSRAHRRPASPASATTMTSPQR